MDHQFSRIDGSDRRFPSGGIIGWRRIFRWRHQASPALIKPPGALQQGGYQKQLALQRCDFPSEDRVGGVKVSQLRNGLFQTGDRGVDLAGTLVEGRGRGAQQLPVDPFETAPRLPDSLQSSVQLTTPSLLQADRSEPQGVLNNTVTDHRCIHVVAAAGNGRRKCRYPVHLCGRAAKRSREVRAEIGQLNMIAGAGRPRSLPIVFDRLGSRRLCES